MSILEILEAHLFVPGGFVDPGNHCSCGNYYNNEYVAGKIQLDEHLAHVAQVLEQHEREAKAEALEEAYYYGLGRTGHSLHRWLRDRAAQIKAGE